MDSLALTTIASLLSDSDVASLALADKFVYFTLKPMLDAVRDVNMFTWRMAQAYQQLLDAAAEASTATILSNRDRKETWYTLGMRLVSNGWRVRDGRSTININGVLVRGVFCRAKLLLLGVELEFDGGEVVVAVQHPVMSFSVMRRVCFDGGEPMYVTTAVPLPVPSACILDALFTDRSMHAIVSAALSVLQNHV